jgi:GT2 family glycosyltransferase
MFLTSILKPRVIVELGTFYGTSYCAFCQAVKELKLDARCYAVDTWEGDPQSGFYGVEILNDLKHHHDVLYGDFSRLIQSTFDEAVCHFTDKAIDLLHIDGFHTYEAVKKDFETWLPKLSETGIVLFHDINVRERDFGVWKFWEEVRLIYPHFEFAHSHGLGVLAVGSDCSEAFNEFLKFSINNRIQITNFFYQQGQRLENLQELQILQKTIPQQKEIICRLQENEQLLLEQKTDTAKSLLTKEKQLNELEQKFLEQEAQSITIVQLQQELETTEKQLTEFEQKLRDDELQSLAIIQLQQELEAKEKELIEENRRLQNKAAELQHAEQSLNEFNQELINKSQRLHGKDWELQATLAKLKISALNDEKILLTSNGKNKRNSTAFKLILGVVTFNNSQEQIAQLLKSIELAGEKLKGLPVEVEVFVVDNGQESYWRESNLPIVRFASEGNVGFGNAMNRLMTTAFADSATKWFLCLNPDGTLHRNALRELLVMSGEHPHSLIEARQFPEEHNKQYDAETFETPWASGACLLICYDIFKKIGGFDPNFFMYLEDVDFSWRARSAGFSVKIAPRAIFGHSVLNREFNARADKTMLLSGRYLASKWQDSKFVKWAEDELVARKYYSSLSALPELSFALKKEENINPQIANFAHYFSFSSPRW